MALLAQRHRDWDCLLVLQTQTSKVAWDWRGSLPGSFSSPAPNTPTSADSWQPEGAILESCCSVSSPTALLAQRHRDWGCFLLLPPQTSNVTWDWRGFLPGSFCTPAPNTRTSAENWQPELSILESCCSASSAHGTARTQAQRLGMLSSLATSNFKRNLGLEGVPARLLSQPCSKYGNVCR